MNNEISQLMAKICANESDYPSSCDLTSSSVQQFKAAVATDLYDDLHTLAAMHGKDADCIAADLLTIALREAFASMTPEQIDMLKQTRQENELQSAQQHMEEQRFDAGCT